MKLTAFVLSMLVAATAHAQQAYPSRPIKVIVPLAAGSAVDNAARIVTARFTRYSR